MESWFGKGFVALTGIGIAFLLLSPARVKALTNLTILITVAMVTLPLSKRLDDEGVGVLVWGCEGSIQSAHIYPALKDSLGNPTV